MTFRRDFSCASDTDADRQSAMMDANRRPGIGALLVGWTGAPGNERNLKAGSAARVGWAKRQLTGIIAWTTDNVNQIGSELAVAAQRDH
jgi:hypothetical protein